MSKRGQRASLPDRSRNAPINQPTRSFDASPNSDLRGRMTSPRRPLFAGQRPNADLIPARMPLSLFLPVLVLLMITVTWGQDRVDEGFDFQLGVRFAGYSLAGLAGLYALGKGRIRFNKGILAWAAVSLFICATAIYSPDRLFSLAAGLAHLSLLLFAWWIVNRYGPPRAALAVALAGLIIGALSVGTYYLFPDIGRSISDSYFSDPGGRMRGVVSQANTLGSISAITILFAAMYFQTFTKRQRALAVLAIGVATFCLIGSESRTSLAALLLCLLLWGLYRTNTAINLFAVVGIALLACLVIAFVPDVSTYLARDDSGPDDLASLNGRARIWAVAWENIDVHPFIGQGYGSSRLILPYDDRLFAAALNTHNLYLELLFSGGLVLLALFAVAMLASLLRSVLTKRGESLVLLLFFLIAGAAEVTPFGGLPLFSAFAFYLAVCLCFVRSNAGRRLVQRKIPNRTWLPRPSVGNPNDRLVRQFK